MMNTEKEDVIAGWARQVAERALDAAFGELVRQVGAVPEQALLEARGNGLAAATFASSLSPGMNAALDGCEDPAERARRLDACWAEIDRFDALAETKMRLLLPKMPRPPLAAQRGWMDDQLGFLSGSFASPVALTTTRLLCQALLHRHPGIEGGGIQACFEAAPGGGIEVEWLVPSRLTWVVGSQRLPWPGVLVRCYRVPQGAPAGTLPVGQTFHVAAHVLEHATAAIEHP